MRSRNIARAKLTRAKPVGNVLRWSWSHNLISLRIATWLFTIGVAYRGAWSLTEVVLKESQLLGKQ